MTIKGLTVGFIGGGNMGEALIKGLLGASLVPASAIHATDVRLERLKELDRQYGIQVSSDNAAVVRDWRSVRGQPDNDGGMHPRVRRAVCDGRKRRDADRRQRRVRARALGQPGQRLRDLRGAAGRLDAVIPGSGHRRLLRGCRRR